MARVPSIKQRNHAGIPSDKDDIKKENTWEEERRKADEQRRKKYQNYRLLREERLTKIRKKYSIEKGCGSSPSMNLIDDVKKQFSLNPREVDELEQGVKRLELNRQMSTDRLELATKKKKKLEAVRERCGIQ
ncbi:uncharacterized protein LOC111696329 [Eurytemora carolleeae]|uniref:uncharacterized protein LOC111696329 n=1 Tax=Eurytemora carolleeae TaxID=1294199 RepID=UPI000C77E5FF|nr:uncharacterized protein LOC111696329 [Eurytemora carolleeae]|eukprot:XP_023321672.1 uncharacterized protein LOC111696329 [Eurytemora affinis]